MHWKSEALLASFSTYNQPFYPVENSVSAIDNVKHTDKPQPGDGNAGHFENIDGAHQDRSGSASSDYLSAPPSEIANTARDGKSRVKCTKEGCRQTFTREFDMRRHLTGHRDDAQRYYCPERRCPRNQEWEGRERYFSEKYHVGVPAVRCRGYLRKDNLLAHQKKTRHGLDTVLQEEPVDAERSTSEAVDSHGTE